MPVITPSAAFIDALRYGSILVTARFTIYTNGVPSGAVYEAQTSTGSITVDRNAAQRRSGQITIELLPTVPPPALMPQNPTSILAPFGNEIFLELGMTGNGNLATTSWTPMGLFAIATSVVDDTTNDLTVTLDLYDRSWTIAQRALINPYNFPAVGGNFATEIEHLLNMVWNQQENVQPLSFNIAPTSAQVPVASYNQGQDPWQACLDMASAIGYELYFDVNGVCVGKPIPNPFTTAVTWNFTDQESAIAGLDGTGSAALFGSAYSTPISVQIEMTRDGIYNDVIVQGTGTSNMAQYNSTSGLQTTPPPALGEAVDNNPQSPTFIGGAMGDVPNFISSSLVGTSPDALAMAKNQLNATLSTSWQITIENAPMPFLDVDDVVTISRERVGVTNAGVVIDTITHAVRYADTMSLTGRVLGQPFYI